MVKILDDQLSQIIELISKNKNVQALIIWVVAVIGSIIIQQLCYFILYSSINSYPYLQAFKPLVYYFPLLGFIFGVIGAFQWLGLLPNGFLQNVFNNR